MSLDKDWLVSKLVTRRPANAKPESHADYELCSDGIFEDDETLEDDVLDAALQECLQDIKAWNAGTARPQCVTVFEDGVRTVYDENGAVITTDRFETPAKMSATDASSSASSVLPEADLPSDEAAA